MNKRKADLLMKIDEVLRFKLVLVLRVFGLDSQETVDFGANLWDAGGNFNLVKNSIAKIAVANANMDFLSDHMSGSVALAYSNQDAPSFLRSVFDFCKRHGKDKLSVLGGKYGNSVFDLTLMRDFASMPDESYVYLSLISALNAAPAALVGILESPSSLLVRYLGAYGKSSAS